METGLASTKSMTVYPRVQHLLQHVLFDISDLLFPGERKTYLSFSEYTTFYVDDQFTVEVLLDASSSEFSSTLRFMVSDPGKLTRRSALMVTSPVASDICFGVIY